MKLFLTPLFLALSVSVLQAQSVASITPVSQATQTAVQNGMWYEPATWGGSVPLHGSKVLIPADVTVTVDGCVTDAPFWVRVEGTLRFSLNVNTCLTVETLAIEHTGRLEVGTAEAPIIATATATITLKALSGLPIDQKYDPRELSRGIVSEGLVSMHHAWTRTPYVSVKQLPAVGATTLTLDVVPVGWLPGDDLEYSGPLHNGEEAFKVKAIEGAIVTLDHPVAKARKYPLDCLKYADCRLHLVNRTRGITIQSDVTSALNTALQGHFMMMHRGGHSFANVAIVNLGRTTTKPVSDPLIGDDGTRNVQLMALCGLTKENVRGRYAFHFHMNGLIVPSNAIGVSVYQRRDSGMLFGFIVHSSNVNLTDTVGINVDGSTYMTEEGDELGAWKNILAIHSTGQMQGGTDHQPNDACVLKNYPAEFNRRRLAVGFQGAGIWLQGGGVTVDGFVCAGMFSTCTDVWTRPLDFRRTNTYRVMMPIALLPGGGTWVLPTRADLGIDFVPSSIKNGVAYGTGTARYSQKTGLSYKYHGMRQQQTFPTSPRNVLENVLVWNAHNALATGYTGFLDLRNVTVIKGDVVYLSAPSRGLSLAAQSGNNNWLTNVKIYGYATPLVLSMLSKTTGLQINGQPIADLTTGLNALTVPAPVSLVQKR